jgi:hypothetical protein
MGFYTDWFIAEEHEAAAIAAIATSESSSFENWPSLSLKGIGAIDLFALARLLHAQPPNRASLGDTLLFQESEAGPFVSRIPPAIIAALAALDESQHERVAGAWAQSESLASWNLDDVALALRELVHFARRAEQSGKPVLQLSVL